ncbi:MAG TPA: lytic murein transglycosylase [Deltaproteobacteria bacterium]|nr:lytic murein transglycosylase [Deltaproteobacteria bacterium]
MKKIAINILILIVFMLPAAPSASWEDFSRVFIAQRLVEKGLDLSMAQNMVYDSRVTLRPDIVIQNLFHSSPRGSEERPSVMRIDPRHIDSGRAFMRQHGEFLFKIEKQFGTSPQIITAILIVESRLGTYPMPYNVVTAYTNQVFLLDPDYFQWVQELYAEKYPLLTDESTIKRAQRRATWALGELYHLAHIANDLGIDPLDIRGSFAGAMGPAQFIPSTFRSYGVDGDGDGIASPFNMKDAKASMAHYLKSSGWSENASVEKKRRAIFRYNRSEIYVNTIMMLYEELGKGKELAVQDFLPDSDF